MIKSEETWLRNLEAKRQVQPLTTLEAKHLERLRTKKMAEDNSQRLAERLECVREGSPEIIPQAKHWSEQT